MPKPFITRRHGGIYKSVSQDQDRAHNSAKQIFEIMTNHQLLNIVENCEMYFKRLETYWWLDVNENYSIFLSMKRIIHNENKRRV